MQCKLLGFKVIRNERWQRIFFSFHSPHLHHNVVVIGMCQSWIRYTLPLPRFQINCKSIHTFFLCLLLNEWVGHIAHAPFWFAFSPLPCKPVYLSLLQPHLHLTTDSCGICQFIRFSPLFSAKKKNTTVRLFNFFFNSSVTVSNRNLERLL